jgi:hypothetical protein
MSACALIALVMVIVIHANDEKEKRAKREADEIIRIEKLIAESSPTIEDRRPRVSNTMAYQQKDEALSQFQVDELISDADAEAAIKEWVTEHNGNFDWNLEEVKYLCIRNRDFGIPFDFLPETVKQQLAPRRR